jgi:hypothetical protein
LTPALRSGGSYRSPGAPASVEPVPGLLPSSPPFQRERLFGSRRLPTGANKDKGLGPLASTIGEHANGKIDVVVVTHRHQDHLSGFALKDVEKLITPKGKPALVVRPWTEEPGLARSATRPSRPRLGVAEADAPAIDENTPGGPGAESRDFVASLEAARRFADKLATAVPDESRLQVAGRLELMAAGQLANKDAVDTLARWSRDGRGSYVYYGSPSRIEEVIPGLRVKVLGPPTIEQHSAILTMKDSDPKEFWMLYSHVMNNKDLLALLASVKVEGSSAQSRADLPDGDTNLGGPDANPVPAAKPVGPIGPIRWLTEKMSSQQFTSLLRIVRIMDDVLNNTSVILQLEVDTVGGPARMLFPGDAQIENWEYALKFAKDKKDNLKALKEVDLYKVGHHGSRNATPHTLFDLWMQTKSRPTMTALMSTKFKVYDDTEATTVPRQTLVDALAARTTLHMTTDLKKAFGWYEVAADLRVGTSFGLTEQG